ncbi:uncharacterized protein M6B38_366410 [Iris pallida]|uniref:Uncharacterized protein n=1 Tax=Iris pallida TaxID=29817 RepID=A0AAX6GG76_IRIPA|nr:uncharacterized protein M6B38_366410 [Iris pallida]
MRRWGREARLTIRDFEKGNAAVPAALSSGGTAGRFEVRVLSSLSFSVFWCTDFVVIGWVWEVVSGSGGLGVAGYVAGRGLARSLVVMTAVAVLPLVMAIVVVVVFGDGGVGNGVGARNGSKKGCPRWSKSDGCGWGLQRQ